MVKETNHTVDDGGQPAQPKTIDKTTSPLRANLLALALTPLLLIVVFLPFVILWSDGPLQAVFNRLISPFLLLLAVSVVAHEALHGLGYALAGRVPWREIAFGVKGLMAYAHCKVPLPASAYRIAVALPGVVLGLIPVAVGIALGNGWLAVFGVLMCVAALGDLVILWLMRSVPGDARVQDHPSAPGCQVLVE